MTESLIYREVEQGTDAWLELRKGKVTASRVADVLAKTKTGVSASRGNYLIELALQRVTGVIEPSFTNDAMQRGIDEEPRARAAYEVQSNNFVDQVAFIDHPTIKGFGCSPDGLIDTDGIVEIKNPNSSTHWATIKANEIPNKYYIQMMAQLSCTGREWNDYVSFDSRFPDRSQLFVKRLHRDDKYIAEMESEIVKFLDEVNSEVELIMKGKS
jgi:putative phage-type endonuclease